MRGKRGMAGKTRMYRGGGGGVGGFLAIKSAVYSFPFYIIAVIFPKMFKVK